jgi:ABC-type thiamin/hydroxymethylpyrimidine transport system permease subunit
MDGEKLAAPSVVQFSGSGIHLMLIVWSSRLPRKPELMLAIVSAAVASFRLGFMHTGIFAARNCYDLHALQRNFITFLSC